MPRSFRLVLSAALLTVFGCDSETVSTFKDHSKAMCGCSDADCAKAEHGKFVKSWADMKSADIDWNSDKGKKDTKKIEATVKEYRGCLDKQIPSSKATEFCQADDAAKKNSEGCTACCEGQGRFFKTWVDPLAAGFASALGAGDVKGCSCS